MNSFLSHYLTRKVQEYDPGLLSWSLYLRFYFSLYFLTSLQWNMVEFFQRDHWDDQTLHVLLFWVPNQTVLYFLAAVVSLLIFWSWMRVLKYPLKTRARLFFSLSAFVGLLIFNSHAKVSHSSVGWILTSLFIVLLNFDGKSSRKNLFLFKSAQTTLLWLYFLSGLWKWRSLFSGGSLFEISASLQYSVAMQAIQADSYHPIIMLLMDLPAMVIFAFWLALVSLQVGAVFLVFKDQWLPKLGFALILFHLATDLMMNISFAPMMALVVALLVWNPYYPLDKAKTQNG